MTELRHFEEMKAAHRIAFPDTSETQYDVYKAWYMAGKQCRTASEGVDIDVGARAVKAVFDMSLIPPDSGFTPEDIAQVCATAWGLKGK